MTVTSFKPCKFTMPHARKDITPWQPGAYYHIYNRGVQKAPLFHEKANYLYVLRKSKRYCQAFQLSIIAYCLMPNHYHFLVQQQGEQAAGLLVQRIFNGYTKAYNKRYGNSVPLFERRYQAKLVKNNAHLLHLCRYIHANPVKDGLVEHPEDWPYSNYLEWVGKRNGSLKDAAFIQAHFKSPEDYQTFVFDYLQLM